MSYKVWVIGNNGSHKVEDFVDKVEGMHYAINRSKSFSVLCTIRFECDKVIVCEYGEEAEPERTKDLLEATEEAMNRTNEHYAKDGRGKACKRKV
jgi:hypothetical protein